MPVATASSRTAMLPGWMAGRSGAADTVGRKLVPSVARARAARNLESFRFMLGPLVCERLEVLTEWFECPTRPAAEERHHPHGEPGQARLGDGGDVVHTQRGDDRRDARSERGDGARAV